MSLGTVETVPTNAPPAQTTSHVIHVSKVSFLALTGAILILQQREQLQDLMGASWESMIAELLVLSALLNSIARIAQMRIHALSALMELSCLLRIQLLHVSQETNAMSKKVSTLNLTPN